MSNHPEEIRRDIERTRAELSQNVNALADGANPATVAKRQVEKVKESALGLKERVFGNPDDPWDDGAVGDARSSVAGAAQDAKAGVADAVDGAAQAVSAAPRQLRRQAQGNPLAAGLIAFGLGALIGGLIPSTRVEQDLATQAKEKAEPLVAEAKQLAADAAEQLKPLAQEAADAVKEAATGATATIKTEAQYAADTVSEQARAATDEVKADDRNPL